MNTCSYHKKLEAQWRCDHCDKNFCRKCVPMGNHPYWGANGPQCALCSRPLRKVDEYQDETPWYEILIQIAKFASAPAGLYLVAASSLLATVYAATDYVLFLILAIISVMGVFLYGLSIIHSYKYNQAAPRAPWENIPKIEKSIIVPSVAGYLAVSIATVVASFIHPLASAIAFSIFNCLLIAYLLILKKTLDTHIALDPKVIADVIKKTMPYFAIPSATGLVFSLMSFAIYQLLAPLGYTWLWTLLVAPTAAYGFLILSTMTGHIGLLCSHQISESCGQDPDDIDKLEFEREKTLVYSNILLKEQRFEQVRNLLRTALGILPDDLELNSRYHIVLLKLDDKDSLKKHGEHYISMLMAIGDIEKGAAVFKNVQSKIKDFRIKDLDSACRIGEHLRMHGHHKVVLSMFHNIHKLQPKNPFVADAYLLTAKIYVDHYNDIEKAEQLLEFVRKNYPKNKTIPAINQYLKTVAHL